MGVMSISTGETKMLLTMKRTLIFLCGGVLLSAAASCSVDNATPVPSDPRVQMEFTAGAPGTRTAISPDNNSVYWTDGDAISVFDGTYNNEFTISSGVGSPNATFSGTATESGKYYALYPYSADADWNGNKISSVLPEDQLGGYNTFSPGTNPSVAVSDGNTLAFHNVAGLVRVTLPDNYSGERKVREIQLSADQSLAGPYEVDMSGSSYSAVATAKTPVSVSLAPVNSDGDFIVGTEFYLVVLPGSYTNLKMSVVFNDGSYMTGTIASAEITAGKVFNASVDPDNATANDQGLYGLYQAGIDIEIGGKTYNIADYGEAQLIVSDSDLSELRGNNSGVYFIDPDATVTFSYTGAIYKLLLIGNDPERRSKVIFDNRAHLNQSSNTDGVFLLNNLDADISDIINGTGDESDSAASYFLVQNADGEYGYVGIINSGITMGSYGSFTYVSSKSRSYAKFCIEDSEFYIPAGTGAKTLLNVGSSSAPYGLISVRNSIFYSDGQVTDFRFVGNNSSQIDIDEFVFENNSLVNIWTTSNSCVRYKSLRTVSVTKNLIWNSSVSNGTSFFRPFDTTDGGVYPGNPTGSLVDDNIVYKGGDTSIEADGNFQWFYGGLTRVDQSGFSVCSEAKFVENSPLGDSPVYPFTQIPEYASYGAQR